MRPLATSTAAVPIPAKLVISCNVTPLDPVEHACPYVKFYMMGVGAAGMTLHEITSFAGIGIAIVDVSKGRIKFNGAKHGAPFPSMVVVFRA